MRDIRSREGRDKPAINGRIVFKLILGINIILLLHLLYTFIHNDILPNNMRLLIFGSLIIGDLFFAFLSLRKNAAKSIVVLSSILILLVSVIEGAAVYYLTRSINTIDRIIEKKSDGGAPGVKHIGDEQPFNVYISGIDTYGEIKKVSRSDVNLIITANPKTRKILITTIPRDTYLPIYGGGHEQYDKLTHSGIYGIDSSLKTLESFFSIKIDYYVRINFTSMIKLVDILGRIDIYNDQPFVSTHGGFDFPMGKIHLDGEKALSFARERYSLADGDLDRGRNHEKIVEAIINKLTSTRILKDYNKILSVIYEATETNMPKSKLMEFINKQLEDNKKWNIVVAEVKGKGTMYNKSYAMPDSRLYTFVPDKTSVWSIRSMMENIINGE